MSTSANATTPPSTLPAGEPVSGFVYAISAYVLWGAFPLYLKAVAHIPVWEVVIHRVIWSVPVALVLLLFMRRLGELRSVLKEPRTLALAALTAGLISINWGTYVWAIATDHAVQGALGYYINPLVNVVLGAMFLGERLTRLQQIAVVCAVIAVTILTFRAGGLPWISLVLAFSFGFYGFFRKTLPVGPTIGFTLEVLILSVAALPVALWLIAKGEGHFGPTGSADLLLLMAAGVVTAIPLVLYASGAKLLRYTTTGVLQYIAPTLIFLIAIFVFQEPFNRWQLIAFCFIWAGLVLYTISLFRQRRAKPA